METARIIDAGGNPWDLSFPDQVTLTQGDAPAALMDGSSNLAPVVIDIRYNVDLLFGPNRGKVVIEAKDLVGPASSGLDGPIQVVFHNDLGVPLRNTPNARTLAIYLHSPTDHFGDTSLHPGSSHFHNVDPADFPGVGVRWPPSAGQLGGLGKLGSGFRQAANLVTSSTPYASSGGRPSRALCGRPAL